MSRRRRSKCRILVVSSHGQAYTTLRGARRMVEQNIAYRLEDGSVRMIETDRRFRSEPGASPQVALIDRQAAFLPHYPVSEWPYGFARYPLPTQTSSRKLGRAA